MCVAPPPQPMTASLQRALEDVGEGEFTARSAEGGESYGKMSGAEMSVCAVLGWPGEVSWER